MKSCLVYLLVLISIIAKPVVTQSCNVCNVMTGYACFSDNQFFKCDANGAFDISSLKTCMTGVCVTSAGMPPCSPSLPPDCPIPPIPTQPPTTAAPTTPATTIVPPTTVVPTTMAPTTTTTAGPFNANTYCASRPLGKYAYSIGCTQYVYCYSSNGIKGAIYTCVGATLFNPSTQSCQSGYICAVTTTAAPTTAAPTTAAPTTVAPTTAAPTTAAPTTVAPTTVAPTTVAPITAAPMNPSTFCSSNAVGKYAYSTGCTKYVYCYLSNGIKGAVYACPGSTLFNPKVQSCQLGYVCV